MTDSLHRQRVRFDLRLDALEAHRRAFSRQLDALDASVVDASPGPGAWSLAQIGEHLLRIDRGLDLRGVSASRGGQVRSRLGSWVLQSVLSLPVRIPAPPSARSVMPSEAPSWPEVRDAWTDLRASWRRALPDLPPEAIVYRHPLAGPLCRDDALAFLLAHHRHHDAQVRRTLRQLTDTDRQLDARPLDQRATTTRRATRTPSASATRA